MIWSWSILIMEASVLLVLRRLTYQRSHRLLQTASRRGTHCNVKYNTTWVLQISSNTIKTSKHWQMVNLLSLGKTYGYVATIYFTVECLCCRCQSLQVHFDLDQCHHSSYTDINEQRAQRRAWQQNLNHNIQRITLELIVNIFRCCVRFYVCVVSFLKTHFVNIFMYVFTGMLIVIWTMSTECLIVRSSWKPENQLNNFFTRR